MSCPLCGGPARHRRGPFGAYWQCQNPECGALASAEHAEHPASWATAPTRVARKQAHVALDRLWLDGTWSRAQVYKQLAHDLGIASEGCHIGLFSTDMCEVVREWAALHYRDARVPYRRWPKSLRAVANQGGAT